MPKHKHRHTLCVPPFLCFCLCLSLSSFSAMDGTRMGSRSSTRHGPASVFSGPVKRWKKTWSPVASSSSNPPATVPSRLLLYKWVPLTPGKEEVPEETLVRSSQYIPVSIILAQRKEASRKAEEETEGGTRQSGDETGDVTPHVEASDHPMESADEQAPVEGTNVTNASHSSASDVPVEIEMKDEVENPKSSGEPSTKVDGEETQVPSESSAGSEGEG